MNEYAEMSEKMKILIISNMYPTQNYPTFGIFVKNQTKEISALGHKVNVISNNNPKMGKKELVTKYSRWMIQFVQPYLKKDKSYEIIHAHYAFPSGAIARLMAKRLNIPYVVTCHGGDLNKMANINPFLKKQTQKVLEDASQVIVVGEDLKSKVLNEYSIPAEKVSLYSMGVDLNTFYPVPKKEARNKTDFRKEEQQLLYVGNLIEEKGVMDLIEAFQIVHQQNNNTVLHLVGQHKQEVYLKRLKDKVSAFGLMDVVYFHGPKPYEELRNWMSAADVFILPSHIEGFGLVAVEAMACETPVVGTRTGGLYHLLKDGAGLLASPKSPKELAEAVQLMLSDNEIKEKAVKKGLMKAEENNASKIADEIVEIYRNILRKSL